MRGRILEYSEKEKQYDKIISNIISYLLKEYSNKDKIYVSGLKNNSDSFLWMNILDMMRLFRKEIYINCSPKTYFKLKKEFPNFVFSFTLKKGKSIKKIQKEIIKNYNLEEKVLLEIYHEYYERRK